MLFVFRVQLKMVEWAFVCGMAGEVEHLSVLTVCFRLSESVVLGMGRGDRRKVTGGSVVWTSLISLELLEKGRMGRCTKPRTRIQVRITSGFRLTPLL